jgi:hypothetical protein
MAMELKRTALAAAIALALAPAAWAGASSRAAEDNASQGNASHAAAEPGKQAAKQAATTEPSAGESAKESLGWTYVNGESTGAQPSPSSAQPSGNGSQAQGKEDDDGRTAATVPGQEGNSAQSAQGQGGPASAETARSDDASPDMTGKDYSAGKENDQTSGGESAAIPGRQGDDMQAEAPAGAGSETQSAQADGTPRDRSARSAQGSDGETWGGSYATLPEVTENDQPAQSPGTTREPTAQLEDGASPDQAAMSDEAQGEGQLAKSEDEGDRTARSEQSGGQAPSASAGVPAGMEGKVIVIIPREWQGSLKDLVYALEASPDARDIVIVQQGEPQAASEDDDEDEYVAERPAGNDEESGEQ